MPGAADETPRPIASMNGALSEGVAAYEDESVQFEDLCKFIGLSDQDFELLKQNETALHTIVDAISPQVYKHLLAYPHTKRGLRSRRQGNEPMSALLPERMKKFAIYLKQLTSWPSHDMPGLQKLMNGMGVLHHKYVDVSLSHLVLSLGAAQNLILSAVASDDMIKQKAELLNALSKLLWLQADSFVTTYHTYHNFSPKKPTSPQHKTAPIPETSDKNTATEDDEDDDEEKPTTATSPKNASGTPPLKNTTRM